jgi:hypothetical protein
MEVTYDMRISDLSPEVRLMLACLRTSPNKTEGQYIEKLSKARIDWPSFLTLLDRHRVIPLVYHNLKRYSRNTIPIGIKSELRPRFERKAYQGLINAAELNRLYKVFQDNGIPVLPLKGSMLALQLYGNLALRHSGDIDLLIDPHHVGLADQILQERYHRLVPAFHLTPYQKKQFDRLFHHFGYQHDQMNIYVELHWRATYNRGSQTMDFARLQSRAHPELVAGSPLPAMSPEDNLLYLCAHGAYHYWYRLFWLVDLAKAIQQYQGIDWNGLVATANKVGLVRPLVQGVMLAHLFLDTPLPDPILAYARRDRTIDYLIKEACWHILCPQAPQPKALPLLQCLKAQLGLLRLCSDSGYKFRTLQRILLGDYGEFMPLPDLLFPLYYLMRPILWLHRRLRRSQDQMKGLIVVEDDT